MLSVSSIWKYCLPCPVFFLVIWSLLLIHVSGSVSCNSLIFFRVLLESDKGLVEDIAVTGSMHLKAIVGPWPIPGREMSSFALSPASTMICCLAIGPEQGGPPNHGLEPPNCESFLFINWFFSGTCCSNRKMPNTICLSYKLMRLEEKMHFSSSLSLSFLWQYNSLKLLVGSGIFSRSVPCASIHTQFSLPAILP
jgi:hypothetical protein